ncbi:MAG: hypothetical protein JSV56_10360, partial [Methanomassiliicoccales archaeon]
KIIGYVLALMVGLTKDRNKLLLFLSGLILVAISVLIDDYLPLLFFFGSFALIIGPVKERIVILLIAFLILSASSLTGQYRPAYVDIADEINDRIEEGDVVALVKGEGKGVRLPINELFVHIAVRDVSIVIYNQSNGTEPRFIVSELNDTYSGYELVGSFNRKYKPSILKSIGMTLTGKQDSDQLPPIYLWERV